jgi:hypothetical protein
VNSSQGRISADGEFFFRSSRPSGSQDDFPWKRLMDFVDKATRQDFVKLSGNCLEDRQVHQVLTAETMING